MKVLKFAAALVLFGALVVIVQLADPLQDSATAKYQRLPDADLTAVAESQIGAVKPDAALLLLDYAVDNNLPGKTGAEALRKKISAQLSTDIAPPADSFASLAGNSVADTVLYGDVTGKNDPLGTALGGIPGLSAVFPPADSTVKLIHAANNHGAINEALSRQLRQLLTTMVTDPKSSLTVEKFKDNFMPIFELAKRCRTWAEFQTILAQADSADQVKVLVKMTTASPAAARRLSQILALAGTDGVATTSACLDHILRRGPTGIDALYAAVSKGTDGLRFVTEHAGFAPQNVASVTGKETPLGSLREKYQALRLEHGAIVPATKYLLIALLCGVLVLLVVPGMYLEKLVARPGSTQAAPGSIHYLLSALAVGVVISALAYLLSLAVRPAADFTGVVNATGEATAAATTGRGDSALLSGMVVLVSLTIHAIVWFFVRTKIRTVEDDESAEPALRLRRLENLDVFLDLPLFTGLALTVVAFILITLDAGMSRHFAYTSTVVGILSSVSLRIRYLYPLKERLIQGR